MEIIYRGRQPENCKGHLSLSSGILKTNEAYSLGQLRVFWEKVLQRRTTPETRVVMLPFPNFLSLLGNRWWFFSASNLVPQNHEKKDSNQPLS